MTNVTITFKMNDGSIIEMNLDEAKIIWEKMNVFFKEPEYKKNNPPYGISEIETINI